MRSPHGFGEAAADLPWAVIGAGVHGLAALKALRQLGVAAAGFEQSGEVGGNWNFGGPTSRVYESTHLISSKPFTQFPDFPMPAAYPAYPSHAASQEYIKRYASHFGLLESIAFGTEVVSLQPEADHVVVTVRDVLTARTRTQPFGGAVVANGHNWQPKLPSYPGLPLFRGEVIHSAQYRSSDQVKGRRVLVVGAGNTGCDIAVEAGAVAETCYHSARRGYWYAPKFAFGWPGDQFADLLLALRLPLLVRRLILRTAMRAIVGDLSRLGLAKPDHAFLETHPIVNELLPYYIRHGRVHPKPDVAAFGEQQVSFTDGSTAEIDMVVFATGYRAAVPFVDQQLLNLREGRAMLARNMFPPAHPAIVVAGLIQPDSGQWALAHWQGMLIAHYARARRDRPVRAREFAEMMAAQVERQHSGGVRYADTTRHHYEVAHQDYLAALQDDIRRLEGSL